MIRRIRSLYLAAAERRRDAKARSTWGWWRKHSAAGNGGDPVCGCQGERFLPRARRRLWPCPECNSEAG